MVVSTDLLNRFYPQRKPMTTEKQLEDIINNIQKMYDRSIDWDDSDDYDNWYRAWLLVAKNICKEVLLSNTTTKWK